MNPNELVDYLRSAKAVRERCTTLFKLIVDGKSDNFIFNRAKLQAAAELTLSEIKTNYPDLNVPYHSRWRHFEVGGIDREAQLNANIKTDKRDLAMSKLELAIVSVLLDAGAGNSWSYKSDKTYARSEGLAVASFDAFMAGDFSSQDSNAMCATGAGLSKVDVALIEKRFQVSNSNPLVGVEGRAKLLQALGQAVLSQQNAFPTGRLGEILNVVESKAVNKSIESGALLSVVLELFSAIWPGRISISGKSLGDVWRYSKLKGDLCQGLVPFHKLSQWLTYSLIEPIEEFGIKVVAMDQMTGLPEYRNGGLFIDTGVLELKKQSDLTEAHNVDSDLVVEWRAATVILLDQLAELARDILKKSEEEFPLAKILQGGTWTAGRKIAAQKRSDGTSPLKINSDGTVF